ncbi:uncharacterized protein LOC107882277 [Acyrthosiphon pisum]|uniref:Regulatory protein zeste n=1 Tax=Acyrthosiphon pisum TaxID=7029 RepID=A0A8R2D1Y8_ACYPI|nr:uncharacterized protein LOC107882277 [Acyrthosiphon pisum]|eukprot:XP_016655898.1 PREDICTED: uncharacterized protein LOC107882277 [Acyrthosiphon pisum]
MSEHNMNESQLKQKRMRGKNFTEREKELLIDLILPFKPIIENIKTDAIWNNKKAEVWSEITSLYNLQQTSGIRIDTQLKNLYDTLKRDARKEKSNDKVQMYKTGGGSNTNLLSKTTEKIIGLLGDQMDPLINSVDSDTNYNDGGFEVVNLFSEDITDFEDSSMYLLIIS